MSIRAGVIVFPGSNCDRDIQVALEKATGRDVAMVWHGGHDLPDLDLIAVPGGFSYGDYLRAGAMASRSPIMREVIEAANKGTPVIGICNGFQVLCESGLLPGALMRNADLHFVCRDVRMHVENSQTVFTSAFADGEEVVIPVAHHDGNYFADHETLDRLEGDGRVAFRYAADDNPNGAQRDIAGIVNAQRNVLGMMPHPERMIGPELGGTDGARMLTGLVEALA